jgi:hypothetical protein
MDIHFAKWLSSQPVVLNPTVQPKDYQVSNPDLSLCSRLTLVAYVTLLECHKPNRVKVELYNNVFPSVEGKSSICLPHFHNTLKSQTLCFLFFPPAKQSMPWVNDNEMTYSMDMTSQYSKSCVSKFNSTQKPCQTDSILLRKLTETLNMLLIYLRGGERDWRLSW